MTQLSPHFALDELVRSDYALRSGIDNAPNDFERLNLSRLANLALEPARDILGVPLHINSGFRSPGVNAAVHGSPHSAHLDGLAADFVPIGLALRNAFDALRTGLKYYDQIIIECNAWIHLSIPEAGDTPRRDQLAASGTPGNWRYSSVA